MPIVAPDDDSRVIEVGDSGHVAVVDSTDFERVSGHRWTLMVGRAGRASYAVTWIDGRTVGMHRIIAGDPNGLDVDHRDGDGLNNRRANLRPATRSQNAANSGSRSGTSQYKGVCWSTRRGRWIAQIRRGGRKTWIGYFDDEESAARAYDAAARAEWGEFAWLNFPEVSA
jgi:hypothetical protein